MVRNHMNEGKYVLVPYSTLFLAALTEFTFDGESLPVGTAHFILKDCASLAKLKISVRGGRSSAPPLSSRALRDLITSPRENLEELKINVDAVDQEVDTLLHSGLDFVLDY